MKVASILTIMFSFSTLCLATVADENKQYKLKNAFKKLSFDNPLDLQHTDDGTNRIFVVSQKGLIYVFKNNPSVKSAKTFLDIRDKVTSGGELGLLGLAFHPDYKNNGYFYVNYTASNPLRSVIARYTVSSKSRNAANKNSERILFQVNQPYSVHMIYFKNFLFIPRKRDFTHPLIPSQEGTLSLVFGVMV
ncbi:MAG TPA: PQQ-dependent sugar dehydrogenase [Candidatus Wunengus sp. YC60]|uniref:PQQ-dependent sugar dehydrogenase n=1 Tax=Candidatus Wunengus sp. YC60 TaxID=3367697 RepID=UPI004026E6EB